MMFPIGLKRRTYLGSSFRQQYGTAMMVGRAVILSSVLVCGAYGDGTVPIDAANRSREADQATKEAAGVAGNRDHRAVDVGDPRDAPAVERIKRWHLGQMEVGGQWFAVGDVQRQAAADPLQATYRQLRTQYGGSFAGQLALARWCRKNGLHDEGRFHWASLLYAAPCHEEALRALGQRWHNGRLLTVDQIEQLKLRTRQGRRSAQRWSVAVAAWQRAISARGEARRRAVREVSKIVDPEAIGVFEQVTLGGRVAKDAEYDMRRELSLAFVSALKDMGDHAATVSLVRHAVLSMLPAVRSEATIYLRYRPLHDYVPLLLGGLTTPVETSYQVVRDPDGSVHYRHTLYQEGPFADREHHVIRATYLRVPATVQAQPAATAALKLADSSRKLIRAQREALDMERAIALKNQAAADLNARIIAVLSDVVGESLGEEPTSWWDWWRDYNEYHHPDGHPVYCTQDASMRYDILSANRSCFAEGTLVWTKTGRQPIESLELGDLVLSQDVDTGELAFKPVIGRTVRPPSPILRVSLGDEQLLATRGHPLWVLGIGWRMAKELDAGAMLHGVGGPVSLASVEDAGEEAAYNLVVADSNTYFVGEAGVLAHDNMPRRPTRSIVPGFIAN
jgi:hypothetical protein